MKGRQRHAADPISGTEIETLLREWTPLLLGGLRSAWRQRFGEAPPLIRSRDVLLRLMAWRIQAEAYGGLDAKTQRKLDSIAETLERGGDYAPKAAHSLSPGVVLTREWKGNVHRVTVLAEGFQYLGKSYGSLSDIARTVTGTRWSGPRFFGLEQKRLPPQRDATR
jgi:hypothetical protein